MYQGSNPCRPSGGLVSCNLPISGIMSILQGGLISFRPFPAPTTDKAFLLRRHRMKQVVILGESWPYLLQENGHCLSEYTGKPINYFVNSQGYPQFTLFNSGKVIKPLVHRVLYEVFIGTIPEGFEVHHKDENPLNFSLDNLVLLSKQEHQVAHTSRVYFQHCTECGQIKPRNIKQKCPTCQSNIQPKLHLTYQDIVDLYHKHKSWVKQGNQVRLSDNGLRKRFIAVGGNPKRIKSCAPSPAS